MKHNITDTTPQELMGIEGSSEKQILSEETTVDQKGMRPKVRACFEKQMKEHAGLWEKLAKC